MVKILERRLTKYQKIVANEDGIIIRKLDIGSIETEIERLTYGQYNIYIFMGDVYKGFVKEAFLWGPGGLVQHDDMTFSFYMEVY